MMSSARSTGYAPRQPERQADTVLVENLLRAGASRGGQRKYDDDG
jgi:hypothetical protein